MVNSWTFQMSINNFNNIIYFTWTPNELVLLTTVAGCFWVFYWKDSTIAFWATWNFTFMELQIRRSGVWLCQYSQALPFLNCYFLNFCFLSINPDVEFGRVQARDMLQHLWTGPISNTSVDVVQGSRSVEVRAVGVTKVSASMFKIQRYLVT